MEARGRLNGTHTRKRATLVRPDEDAPLPASWPDQTSTTKRLPSEIRLFSGSAYGHAGPSGVTVWLVAEWITSPVASATPSDQHGHVVELRGAAGELVDRIEDPVDDRIGGFAYRGLQHLA